ncbi:MAG: HD domain-containing protein [Erysipelotrichaceae bacterium]
MKDYPIKFKLIVNDLLNNKMLNELAKYNQHLNSSRLEHCVDVAYLTFKLTSRLKLSADRIEEATQAALLHDLFLYDWRGDYSSFQHLLHHPLAAVMNAREITNLNNRQENIILSHMFPLAKTMPKSIEAWIVQYADKYSAIKEYAVQYYMMMKNSHVVGSLLALFLFMKK